LSACSLMYCGVRFEDARMVINKGMVKLAGRVPFFTSTEESAQPSPPKTMNDDADSSRRHGRQSVHIIRSHTKH
jgi:hypothetical protein